MAIRVTNDASVIKRSANVPPSTGFTLAGWFRFDSFPAHNHGPLGIYAGSDGAPSADIDIYAASGTGALNLASSTGTDVALKTVRIGGWYFIALTGSGTASGTVKAYARERFEGTLTKVQNGTTFASVTAARIEWGRTATSGEFINGAVQKAIAFDRVLDEGELMKLSVAMLAEKPLPDRRNLNVYYRLRGNHDIVDLSGNQRAATMTVGANAQGVRVWTRRRPTAFPPGGNVTVALTGVAATSAVGNVTPSCAVPVTGLAATGSPGNVAPATAPAITGNAATTAVGNVTPSTTVGITGNAATGQIGSPGAAGDAAASITGVEATGQVGNVTPGITVAASGVAASTAVGAVAPTIAPAITGVLANAGAGNLTPSTTVGITGAGATADVGTVTPQISGDVTVALTGVQASGQVGNVGASGGDPPAGGSGDDVILRRRRRS